MNGGYKRRWLQEAQCQNEAQQAAVIGIQPAMGWPEPGSSLSLGNGQ